jgi:Amt family ammonium transporter
MPPSRAAAALAIAALAAAPSALAQASQPDSGDTAWMLAATALVLFMTVPGLALFYAGMVRAKNVLSVMMQCFAITALISVLWVAYGYSLAFDATGMRAGEAGLHAIVGTLHKAFLAHVARDALTGTIPESLFATYQMTFAIITPALIVGAFAECSTSPAARSCT